MDGWRSRRRGVLCPGASPVAGIEQPAAGSVTEQTCAARQSGVRPQTFWHGSWRWGGLFGTGVTWRERLRVERNSRLCGRER